ncbi:MAG TPA: hypothetical protein VGF81_08255 [Solirubrobacteraceae bacterium]|jgi:hypothetical protein
MPRGTFFPLTLALAFAATALAPPFAHAGGYVRGCADTKFSGADATLVEWYRFSQSSFDGFPPPDEQGYILQYAYNSPRPRTGDILWAWGQAHVDGVLAYY